MFLVYDQKVRKINETVSKSTLGILRETSQLYENTLGKLKYRVYRKINKSSQSSLFIISMFLKVFEKIMELT